MGLYGDNRTDNTNYYNGLYRDFGIGLFGLGLRVFVGLGGDNLFRV